MPALLHKTTAEYGIDTAEIEKIAGFYGFDTAALNRLLHPLAASFSRYFEIVFGTQELELITAGKGNAFALQVKDAALQFGLSEKTAALFLACSQQFPDAIAGIKCCFSVKEPAAPTLYVRVKCGMTEGLRFLEQTLGGETLRPLREVMNANHVLYGLGFSEKNGALYLKTYTIGTVEDPDGRTEDGFVSWRLSGGQLAREHKTYLPEVPLPEFHTKDAALARLTHFLVHDMAYTKAGHIGLLHREGKSPEYKIYVERLGGIPTDFNAR